MDEQNLFIPDENATENLDPSVDEVNNSITWTASEFVNHSKNIVWYLLLLLAIVLASSLVYVFTHNILSAIVVLILGLSLCFMATRKPKENYYGLDSQGIVINNVDHPFAEYKSYMLVSENGHDHILLISVKRLIPNKAIYFGSQDKDRIMSILEEFLPTENVKGESIEKFMKKIGL